MIPLGATSPKATVTTGILSDTFTGVTLDTGEWTASTKGASTTVTQNDALILTLTAGALSNARVLSSTLIPAAGLVSVSFDWTPGKLYSGATGRPYVAILPIGADRDTVSYEYPYFVPCLKLGDSANTTIRTILTAGLLSSNMVIYSGSATATTGTWYEGTTYSVQWLINWQINTMSLLIDSVPLLVNTPFTYSPPGDLMLEIGNCDYGAASNAIEKFDNLVVTQTL